MAHALSRLRRLRLVIPVLALCLLLDQASKQVASLTLSPLISKVYLGGVLKFIYMENTGIVSNLGVGLSDSMKVVLFTLLPSLLSLILLVVIVVKRRISSLTLIACALIIGGGMGNVIDRLVNAGAVIDFIYFDVWGRLSGVFNIADAAISVGSAILIIQILAGLARHKPGAQGQFFNNM